jgi:hypothetical protein
MSYLKRAEDWIESGDFDLDMVNDTISKFKYQLSTQSLEKEKMNDLKNTLAYLNDIAKEMAGEEMRVDIVEIPVKEKSALDCTPLINYDDNNVVILSKEDKSIALKSLLSNPYIKRGFG